MIPYLSESLRDYIKPKIVYQLSSIPDKYISIEVPSSDEYSRKNHVVNGSSLVVFNATTQEICSVDRYGFARKYDPANVNVSRNTYINSGHQYVGITLTVSCCGNDFVESAFVNRLAKSYGKNLNFTKMLIDGRDKFQVYGHSSKEWNFYAVTVKIDLRFFKEIAQPIFFKELDIVISLDCNYEYMYHPQQPGCHVFDTNLIENDMRTNGYAKSYLLVENRSNVIRDVWILSGLEIVHLKSINKPDIESGVYINKNNSDYDGSHDCVTSFCSYENFIDNKIAFGNFDEALKRLAFIKECMKVEESAIEAKRIANKKLELDYFRSVDASNEKKENKYIDTLLTILKYGSIIAAAVLLNKKAN